MPTSSRDAGEAAGAGLVERRLAVAGGQQDLRLPALDELEDRAAERLFALEAGDLGAAAVLQRRVVVVGEIALLDHPPVVAALEDHDVQARELELVHQPLRLDQVLVRRDGAEVDRAAIAPRSARGAPSTESWSGVPAGRKRVTSMSRSSPARIVRGLLRQRVDLRRRPVEAVVVAHPEVVHDADERRDQQHPGRQQGALGEPPARVLGALIALPPLLRREGAGGEEEEEADAGRVVDQPSGVDDALAEVVHVLPEVHLSEHFLGRSRRSPGSRAVRS